MLGTFIYLIEADQIAQTSGNDTKEPHEEECPYEITSVPAHTTIPLAADQLGLHIQKLQRQGNGFQKEFKVKQFLVYNSLF